MYHNNDELFASNRFTLVPKAGFSGLYSEEKLKRLQNIYQREAGDRVSSSMHRAHPSWLEGYVGRMRVEQVLRGVSQITILQAQDPGWFLARAFLFTSRTTHGFFIKNIKKIKKAVL